MPMTFALFTPEGVYVEGTGYRKYCSTYLVYFLSAARNCFGTISEYDRDNTGIRKLTVHLKFIKNAKIDVILEECID